MGCFFLTNDPSALDPAERRFRAKGFRRFSRLSLGTWKLLNAGKIAAPTYDNVHQEGKDFVVGYGAYHYEGRFADESLPLIWRDRQAGGDVFSHVGGHCAFVLNEGGCPRVVTDKMGVYHVYHARSGASHYVSPSLLAVGEALPKVTLSSQECLEFVQTEATFGGRTVFEEIEHLPAGCILDFSGDRLTEERYYRHADEPVSFDELISRLTAAFGIFRNIPYSLTSDLTGGHDSRTVAAALLGAGASPTFSTNTNDSDPDDHRIAMEIASCVDHPIRLYEKRPDLDTSQLPEQCFQVVEVSRNMHRAQYTPVWFEEKGAEFAVLLGGYGGELYRESHSKYPSLADYFRRAYLSKAAGMTTHASAEYLARLEEKFATFLDALGGEDDVRKAQEKIYAFEKMRFWGGSRITAFNQFAFRLHPLLDDLTLRHLFDVPLEEKLEGRFQRRVIAALAPELAAHRYTAESVRSSRRTYAESLRRLWRKLAKKTVRRAKQASKTTVWTDDQRALAARVLPDVALRDVGIGRWATIARAAEELSATSSR